MLTIFISDLHLDYRNNSCDLFIEFINSLIDRKDVKKLYILGDLFNLWLGDDLEIPRYQSTITALHKLSLTTQIFMIYGNRDFLIGKDFCKQTSINLLPDPSIITLDQQHILITHGDKFCKDDKSYQRIRPILQSNLLRTIFLAIPKKIRSNIGLYIQKKFKQHTKAKNIKDLILNETMIMSLHDMENFNYVVHGHTHLPKECIYTHIKVKQFTLGEWKNDCAYILVNKNNQFELIDKIKLNNIDS